MIIFLNSSTTFRKFSLPINFHYHVKKKQECICEDNYYVSSRIEGYLFHAMILNVLILDEREIKREGLLGPVRTTRPNIIPEAINQSF